VLELIFVFSNGTAVVLWHCTTSRSWVWFQMVSLEFFIDIILLDALWPWGWLSLKRNEYQEYFLGGKGGWCAGLTTLPPLYADSWNLGASPSWNPQGLSRPVMGFLYLFTALAFDTLARKNCQSQAIQSNISSWEPCLQLRICPYGTLNIVLRHWHVYGLSQCFIPIPIIRKYFCIVFIVQ